MERDESAMSVCCRLILASELNVDTHDVSVFEAELDEYLEEFELIAPVLK